MISKTAIAAGLIALTTLAAVPAQASGLTVKFGFGRPAYVSGGYGYGWHKGKLSPHQIRWILRSKGYGAINFLDRKGPAYEVIAFKSGKRFYVVVSSWNGGILARHVI